MEDVTIERCPVQTTEWDESDATECRVNLIWKFPNCKTMECAVKHSDEMDHTVDEATVKIYDCLNNWTGSSSWS